MLGFFCLDLYMIPSYFVYILESEILNRFYTGSSSNFELRKTFHDNPEARKFTARAKDWELFLKIDCDSKQQAISIEKHIKNMKSSKYIKNLVIYPEIIQRLKEKYKNC